MSKKQTNKELHNQIKSIEKQIWDSLDINKHCPERLKLFNELKSLEDEYYEKNKSQIAVWKSDIEALKIELKERKKDKAIQLNDRLTKWFQEYGSGCNWGYKPLRIIWVSEDERFVIINWSGATAGTGTAMGTGGYYYSPTTHWIADTTKGRYIEFGNKFMEVEGRLTKEKKQALIDHTIELRKKG